MMRRLALFLAPFVCLTAAPFDIEALIGQARSAPPEFSADALIRLAGVSGLAKDRRMALLEEAFHNAAGAQQPYKRRFAAIQTGGPSRFYNQVYSQDLDGLSLRLRAVDAMLPLDARKARELFEQIAPPDLPRLSCDDFLTYDVSRLYDVLARVAAQGFNSEEIARRAPMRLLGRYVAISSPAQVGPAARLLTSAGLSDRDFKELTLTYAAALRGLFGDDRSFTSSSAAGPQIQALAKECDKREIGGSIVIEAYRAYLVNHLSGARCADSQDGGRGQTFGLTTGSIANAPAGAALNFFNDTLASPPVQPISAGESTPSKQEGSVAPWRLCENTGCKEIVSRYRNVIMNPSGIPYTTAEKSAREWKNRLDELLDAMASWKEDSGTKPADFFREKAEIYSDLFGVVSDNYGRERVARADLAFLSQSRYRAESPIEWFLPVSLLIGRVRMDAQALAGVMDEIQRNHDALIGLFMELEKVAPRPAENILTLM
jgi:hypothetical protein